MTPVDKRNRKRAQQNVERVCLSVPEFLSATGLSRSSAYRLMAARKIRFVALTDRTRKIPISELTRLGLSET
jgi:hypothetical protein